MNRLCVDCNIKILSHSKSLRCRSCEAKRRWKNGLLVGPPKGVRNSPSSEFKPGVLHFSKLHPEKLVRDEKHLRWKGDNVGLVALHTWVERRLGRPRICTNCGTKEAKIFDWANISHNYKRDLTDWIRLCRLCHVRYDRGRLELALFKV